MDKHRQMDHCLDVRPKTLHRSVSKTQNKQSSVEKLLEKTIHRKSMSTSSVSLTDDEKVNNEKQYYNIVYMSYDDEGLLKELNSKPPASVDEAPTGEDGPETLLIANTNSIEENIDESSKAV